jgi:hypothetical protein
MNAFEKAVRQNAWLFNATGLREPISWDNNKVLDVAADVTDANMKFWMKMQLMCSDEQVGALGFDFFRKPRWRSLGPERHSRRILESRSVLTSGGNSGFIQ